MDDPVQRDGPTIGYVMTHYPRTALTFISLEIREIQRLGGRVVPVSVNEPSESDLRDDASRRAHDSTLYLKRRGPLRLGAALATALFRHRLGMCRLLALAVSSARLDLPLAARRLVHLAYACEIWSTVHDAGVRHFHAHFGQTPATIAWFTAEVGNLSEPGTCTWSFTIHGFQDFSDERVTRLDLKARRASFVVCVSDFTRAQLCRATDPSTWDRFTVIRCGIDLGAFTFRSPPALRCPPRLVIVARLSPEKGHLILLDAMASLRREGIELELRIIGDGPSAPLIRGAVERLGLQHQVDLVGELSPEAVSAELRQADVFCLPSFSEGIPVSVMEAMAIGVPVVTTFVGGIPELAVDGHTALVVAASDASALGAAVRRLVTDEQLRQWLARNARAAVVDRHDITRNVAGLAALFPNPTATQDSPAARPDLNSPASGIATAVSSQRSGS